MSGGRFYLGGTVVGALFIQTLTTTIYSIGVPPEITLVVKAIVVIIVCIIQSPEFRKMLNINNTSQNYKEKEVVKDMNKSIEKITFKINTSLYFNLCYNSIIYNIIFNWFSFI